MGAMRVCGNKKEEVLPDGSLWQSPEHKYRQAVLMCRDGHADGSGWEGDAGDKPDEDATEDDHSYTKCLQSAYDLCVASEPESEGCASRIDDENYQCTFCKDCDTGESKKTCYTYMHVYESAAQSCFNDDNKKGYQACLNRAAEVYALEVAEREKICEKTFIEEKAALTCDGGFGYVACCCMVKGMMIQHPHDQDLACNDKKPFDTCMIWKEDGYCDPSHEYYDDMVENCRFTCGLCGYEVPGSCARPSGYCTHAGSTYEFKDCDGDGIKDPVCSDTSGNFGVIQSSNGCASTWPNGTCEKGCTGSAASKEKDNCMCTGAMEKHMARFKDESDYMQAITDSKDKAECEALSGKFKKKKGCAGAKNVKKIKCSKAKDYPALCRALGCDLVMRYTGEGVNQFECGGKPMALM